MRMLALQYQHKIIKTMKICAQEVCQTSESQPYHIQPYTQPFFYYFDLNQAFFNTNSDHGSTFETEAKSYYNLKIDQQFTRKTNTNIVIRVKEKPQQPVVVSILNQRPKEKKRVEKKIKSKPIQKESRNVHSNVLRIFFKSIIEMGTYDALIKRVIQKSNFRITIQDFYSWLLEFNINYKNYIRSTQLQRLLCDEGHSQLKMILLVVLRHYLSNHAVSHCMTSRRIELSSLKMHLSGLKELYQEIIKMKQQSS